MRRDFHIGTADALRRLVKSFTATGPPSSEMTSSMLVSCLTMTDASITSRDIVKRHKKKLEIVPYVYKIRGMAGDYEAQGRRLRLLRQAEGIRTGSAFAARLGWGQSGYSQFETGSRAIPRDKALQLKAKIAGFDPLWLWEGDKRGLSFDLRRRIEAEEAKESAASERQDV